MTVRSQTKNGMVSASVVYVKRVILKGGRGIFKGAEGESEGQACEGVSLDLIVRKGGLQQFLFHHQALMFLHSLFL
jgi:hypothetical protein